MALMEVVQRNGLKGALFHLRAGGRLVEKSYPTSQKQELLENIHIADLYDRAKIFYREIFPAESPGDDLPVAGSWLAHKQSFPQKIG